VAWATTPKVDDTGTKLSTLADVSARTSSLGIGARNHGADFGTDRTVRTSDFGTNKTVRARFWPWLAGNGL